MNSAVHTYCGGNKEEHKIKTRKSGKKRRKRQENNKKKQEGVKKNIKLKILDDHTFKKMY